MKGLPPAVPPQVGEGGDGDVPMARSTGSNTSSPVTVMTAAQKVNFLYIIPPCPSLSLFVCFYISLLYLLSC